jgi:hypothetical protein
MQRALLVVILVSIMLGACTQRMICPAYQSAFIYDKDQLRKRFSYFQEDSTPKILTASRNKYLIAEAQPYKKRVRNLQTVKMKPVSVVVPDSLKPEDQRESEEGMDGEDGVVEGAELDLAARSVIDSTFIVDVPQAEEKPAEEEDSVYMITKDKELRLLKYNTPDSLIYDASTGKYTPQKPTYSVVNVTFNVEQDNYMWYLRDYLVLPDVRLARNRQGEEGESEEGTDGTSGKKSKKKKGIKGFFKNLFGKDKDKDKETEEPAEELAPKPVDEEETFDYIEEDEQATPPADTPTEEEKPAKKERKKKEKKPKEEKPKKKKKSDTEDTTPPPPEEETPPPVEEPRDEDSF